MGNADAFSWENYEPSMREEIKTNAKRASCDTSRIEQGFVWALAMIILSPALYVLAFGLGLVVPRIDFIPILCPFLTPITELIEKSKLLQTQDIGIYVVYGHVIPAMIAGFVFGIIWGKRIAYRYRWLQQRIFVICSTLLVLAYCGYVAYGVFIHM